MTAPYRDQLLERLSDGEWHYARDVAHPYSHPATVAAFVRILRASGYVIEEGYDDGQLRFRLVAYQP